VELEIPNNWTDYSQEFVFRTNITFRKKEDE
jgi:hypothetical protein